MMKMLKKTNIKLMLLTFMLFCISFACIPVFMREIKNVQAETNGFWNQQAGVTGHTGWLGSGTSENPYQIGTPEDLALLSLKAASADLSDLNSKYFVLTDNIDLSGHYFTPIMSPNVNSPLMGITFDGKPNGQQFTISNLTISSNLGSNGLFGALQSSTIRNLILEDVNLVSSSNDTGAVAGTAQSVRFENITVSGTITASRNNTGGIAGKVNGNSFFDHCTNQINITCNSGENTGGIFGNTENGALTLTNCKNAGNIIGVTYVAGIGSGTVATTTVFTLDNCVNEKTIQSRELSHGWDYFAGLIAYAGDSADNIIKNSCNLGEVNAPESCYVAGLVGFGTFQLEGSYNNAGISGQSFVGGLAASGTFSFTECYNGTEGDLTAYGFLGKAVAGGFLAESTGLSTVELSYNKGDITLLVSGVSAGFIGSYPYNNLSSPAGFVAVSNCYNWGVADYAFIGESHYENELTVEWCYNRYPGSAMVDAGQENVQYNHVQNGGTWQEINNALALAGNPRMNYWKVFAGYNEGFPYIHTRMVSELSVYNDGNLIGFYVKDIYGTTDFTFTLFEKTGYRFIGFSTIEQDTARNGRFFDYVENVFTVSFEHQESVQVLYAQYILVEFTIKITQISEVGSDNAWLYLWDGTDYAAVNPEPGSPLTINLGDAYKLIAHANGVNPFAFWAIKTGDGEADYIQVSSEEEVLISDILTPEFLRDYLSSVLNATADAEFSFIAVFEQSWEVEIGILMGNSAMGSLEISVNGVPQTYSLTNPLFRIPKGLGGADVSVDFTLKANKHFTLANFAITDRLNLSDISEIVSNGDGSKSGSAVLKNNIQVLIGFEAKPYHFTFITMLEGGGTPQDDLFGQTKTFEFGQSNLSVSTPTGVTGYRFLFFQIKVGNTYYDLDDPLVRPYVDMDLAGGKLTIREMNSDFLEKFFNESGQTITLVAVYREQRQLQVILNGVNMNADTLGNEFGSATVQVNAPDGKPMPYVFGDYYDIGSTVTISLNIDPNCEVLNFEDGILSSGRITSTLSQNRTIVVELGKIVYQLNFYNIDHEDKERYTWGINLGLLLEGVPVAKEDAYVTYGSNFVLLNNSDELETYYNMQFKGWYYIDRNGELVLLSNSSADLEISNLSRVFINDAINEGSRTLTIVAKIINNYSVTINISTANQKRGTFEVFEEVNGQFEPIGSNDYYEFNVGRVMKIVVEPANVYYALEKFEHDLGASLRYSENPLELIFVLDDDFGITILFEAIPFSVHFGENTSKANGTLTSGVNTGSTDTICMENRITFTFDPKANFQTREFTINGKTLAWLESEFDAQIIGNSIVIEVTKEFLEWMEDFNGNFTVKATTMIATLYLAVLLAVLVLVPLLTIITSAMVVLNARKRKLAMEEEARSEKTRRGHEMSDKIRSVLYENKGDADVQSPKTESDKE